MKRLKFWEGLPDLVLSGKKTATWRVNDDKDLSVGDELSLCRNNGIEFAKAKVISVKETSFGKLAEEDKVGHESYRTEKQVYETFSGYYKFNVTPQTKLKIVRFVLLS